MALQPWRVGKIMDVKNETEDTRRFWFEVPELSSFDFKPGQFVTFDLPIHEKPNKRWRSYSIASHPDGTNVFELVIVLDRKGAGTHYLFDEAGIGSEISFRGPQGVFNLREPLDKEIFMICTGTGVAPFRSMIQHIHNTGMPHKKVNLIFGCRTQQSLLYYQEFLELEKTMPGFKYIPTLSREEWNGRTGYVHSVYEEMCKDKQPASFYLCGWKGMIDEAKERIHAMGYEKKDIHLEIYG